VSRSSLQWFQLQPMPSNACIIAWRACPLVYDFTGVPAFHARSDEVHMFERILMVCVGNICRSPTAEYLLRHRLGGDSAIRIASAGLSAQAGHPIDSTALQLLHEHGIDGGQHSARRIDAGLLRESSLILAMERTHVAAIVRMAPEVSGKLFLLDKWLEARDIPDPYRQQRPAFEHVYTMIDRGVSSWLRFL
jgi:protein-tyrosine phosphatase